MRDEGWQTSSSPLSRVLCLHLCRFIFVASSLSLHLSQCAAVRSLRTKGKRQRQSDKVEDEVCQSSILCLCKPRPTTDSAIPLIAASPHSGKIQRRALAGRSATKPG